MSYEVIDTPSGNKSLIFKNGREIRIHSAYDPVREAERSVEQFNPGKKAHIAITGLGLGYHASLLKKKFPDKTILAIEKDHEVTNLAKRFCPDNLAGISVITNAEEMSSLFEEMDISTFHGFAVFTHRPSYSIDVAFYDNFIIEINKYASSKISDLLTRFAFEEKWAANIITNLPTLCKSRNVSSLFGAFRGYPGVIVSAGPSLKKNAALLNSIKDRALICCVDTSFKVLSKMGISPHIVMTLDAQEHSIRHFLGIKDTRPHLIADLVSYPKIAGRYGGNIFFSSTSKYYNDESGSLKRETTPLMDWVEKYIPNIGDIQSGGSVATSLFDFMLNAGCDPIILIGQDLSYTGREIHTSGTYHNDEWLTLSSRLLNLDTINQRIIRKRKIKYVESWGSGKPVITDFVLDLYRQWFEDSVSKVSLKVINASEGGAKVNGTVEMRLSDVCGELTPKQITPAMIIETIASKSGQNNPEQMSKAAKDSLVSISHLAKLSPNDSKAVREASSQAKNNDLAKLFSPFLKKTNAYLNRHPEITDDQAEKMIARDIIRASQRLEVLFGKMLNELNRSVLEP